jgi:hypothetical protein
VKPATPLHEVLERDWDRQLFAAGRKPGLATTLGWTSHWTFNSKGSAHGFPDRTLARERIIFVELKRDLTGRASEDRNRQPSEQQREWLDRLAAAGGEVYLWRPSDLDEIARILSKLWSYNGHDPDRELSMLHRHDEPPWRPRSLWIGGIGRADTLAQPTLEQAAAMT